MTHKPNEHVTDNDRDDYSIFIPVPNDEVRAKVDAFIEKCRSMGLRFTYQVVPLDDDERNDVQKRKRPR